jgi:hypothetical protein
MDAFERWFEALEERHLRVLTFQEVRRAVQALSSLYVERRAQITSTQIFGGAGKRAAFAYFYAPLHFLLVREIVRSLKAAEAKVGAILDLGCGTGAAGAAWALEMKNRPRILGIDRNPWAIQEARWNYATWGLSGAAKVSDIAGLRIPLNTAIIAAFTINELPDADRAKLRSELLKAHERGSAVLIIEPIARGVASWWDDWQGRADEWRFRPKLPERLALMDKAAGLDHRELTARSLWLPA